MNITPYTPEMNETRPAVPLANAEYFYGHYYVNTRLELSGRGIRQCDNYDNFGTRMEGEHTYEMTPKAFDKFNKIHAVSMRLALD